MGDTMGAASSASLCAQAYQLALEIFDIIGEMLIGGEQLLYRPAAMKHCGVALITNNTPYTLKVLVGMPARQVHGHLPRKHEVAVALIALHLPHGKMVVIGHQTLDFLYG